MHYLDGCITVIRLPDWPIAFYVIYQPHKTRQLRSENMSDV